MLAEAITDENLMLKLIGLGILVGTLTNTWLGVRNGSRRDIHPQPLEVKGTIEFARKEELHTHVRRNEVEHDNMFKKLGGVERGLSEKISAVSGNMHALTASNNQQNEQLAEMRETLKDMPSEIIALLKNTGAIK